jgi:hypothetical protein
MPITVFVDMHFKPEKVDDVVRGLAQMLAFSYFEELPGV